MNLDHLLSLVRRPENLDGTHTADLEALVQEYPFFTAGHLLLLKAYKQQNSIHFKKQLRKVAAIAPDRAQVYALTEAWPETDRVEIDGMGEKLPVDAVDEVLEPPVLVEVEPEMVPALAAEAVAELAELPAEAPESTAFDSVEEEQAVELAEKEATPAAFVLEPEEPGMPEPAAMESAEAASLPEEMQGEAEVEALAKAEESAETAAAATEVVFAFDPERDELNERPEEAPLISEEEVLALVSEIALPPREEQLAVEDIDIQLAPTEDGALHFAFEPASQQAAEVKEEAVSHEVEQPEEGQAVAEEAENEAITIESEAESAPEPEVEKVPLQQEEVAAEVLTETSEIEFAVMDVVEETTLTELAVESAPEVTAVVADVAVSMPEAPATEPAADLSEEFEVFVARPHDRLSWFRFFAGKPLREQPDEVLEQLYMEHMQQDLLQAPVENPVEAIKVRVNKAEEVASSREMEEEIKRLAYDSISDDELPASETLARIYEQQQEYKRAIKIYQKLILKFPDKMTYFAGLIEELRKK